MKLIIVFILLLISIRAFAPGTKAIYIAVKDALTEFDALIKAVAWVESKNGLYVYNPVENAVGWLQIRQIRIDHYNKLRGTNYSLEDCYNYELSKDIFVFFAQGKSYKRASMDWNGSGPKTIEYWNKVRARL